MTATRVLKLGTIVAAVAVWLAAAALLWRTRVPAGLELPHVDPARIFPQGELRRAARYEGVGRALFVATLLVQLGVLLALVRAARRLAGGFALGPVGSGVMVATAAALFLWLARLPFDALGLWWDRRYGISTRPYGAWVGNEIGALVGQVAAGAVVVCVLMLLARRFRRRWWAIAAPLGVLAGALIVFLSAFLTAAGTERLRDRALRADVERLAAREGVAGTRIHVEDVGAQTRAVNAETTGIGPSTVVLLWSTLFHSGLGRGAIEFVAAHELGHVARRHVSRGIGWSLLFAAPLLLVLAELTRRRGGLHRPEVIPFALLASTLLQLGALPLENVVSRRYESEADWLALQATRDPAAARDAFRSFTRVDLAQPSPPLWSYVLLETHPTVAQRLAMVDAWTATARPARGPRGGS
jgi:STE24 endopeptidase